ncbi:unnamed protein product [Urochloa humidicola]
MQFFGWQRSRRINGAGICQRPNSQARNRWNLLVLPPSSSVEVWLALGSVSISHDHSAAALWSFTSCCR